MKSGGYKKGGTIDAVCNCKGGFVILQALQEGEVKPKENGKCEGLDCLLSFPLHDAVMSSCDCNPGGKENGRVK